METLFSNAPKKLVEVVSFGGYVYVVVKLFIVVFFMFIFIFSLTFRYLIGQYVTIHDDVISHINITSVNTIDGGLYGCSATNSIGSIIYSAKLNVYGNIRVILYDRVWNSKIILKSCPSAN